VKDKQKSGSQSIRLLRIVLIIVFLSLTVGIKGISQNSSKETSSSRIENNELTLKTDAEAQKLIEILRKREASSEVILAAIKTLGDKRAKEAVPDLIKYLDYERQFDSRRPAYAGGVKVDGTEVGRTITISGRYPATAALIQIGKHSLLALLSVVKENDSESLKFENALYTIQFILRDDLSEAIKYFEKEKRDSDSEIVKQRISDAIEKTRKEYLTIEKSKVN
jgi:hypothetical protein